MFRVYNFYQYRISAKGLVLYSGCGLRFIGVYLICGRIVLKTQPGVVASRGGA